MRWGEGGAPQPQRLWLSHGTKTGEQQWHQDGCLPAPGVSAPSVFDGVAG